MQYTGIPQNEWTVLIEKIAGSCKTSRAADQILNSKPNLKEDEILKSWSILSPLKELVSSGYTPSVGTVEDLGMIFRSLSIGGILDGESLRSILELLISTRDAKQFCDDFKKKCNVLERFSNGLFTFPKILRDLERSVTPDGEITDEASKALGSIRGQKRHLATKIQTKIKSLLHDTEVEMYLQDDFFTVRNDRYVIPMKLDGHGRIKGNVIDTSSSGQTLFLEPQEVVELNQKLLDLESEEKLEVLSILKAFSATLTGNLEALSASYDTIIELDFYTAQARVFSEVECHQPNLSAKNTIHLLDAFHPVLKLTEGEGVIKNDIKLTEGQSCLVISGPNAGGKTVVLKTVAFCHIMAKSGFLVPCSPDSHLYIFDNIYLELGDGQSVTQSLSTFSSHLHALKPIIESASFKDLVLLDEIAVGTEPNAGAAIAQSVLEALVENGTTTLVTTHFEKLKILAIENKKMRNASMEYSTKTYSPTFKLILDVPGQSFALELATKIGLPASIIEKAKVLSGQNTSDLDKVIGEIMKIKQTAMTEATELKEMQLEAQKQKNRWQHEVELLQQTRKKAADKLKNHYEQQFKEKISEVNRAKKELKKATVSEDHIQKAKSKASDTLNQMKGSLKELDKFSPKDKKTPGFELTWDQAEEGMEVFVIPLDKTGTVTQVVKNKNLIEVQVGLLKVRPKISEVRRMKTLKGTQKKTSSKPSGKVSQASEPDYIIQTSSNSVNLRGLDVVEGTERALRFIDSGLLKGEKAIFLIHGHGTSALKQAIRDMLKNDCPYDVSFRPGEPEEGGDGVTVVFYK